MAEPVNSIAALMKSNARLKKNTEVAKKVVARKDYSGPEGDVVCHFTNKAVVTIDSVPAVILEFRVDGSISGQGDYNGERISLFHKFQDDQWNTVESVQARLFEDLQLMGIDTVNVDLEGVDKLLEALRKNGSQFTLRVVKKKGKGANSGKTYTNYRLAGIIKSTNNDYSDAQGDATNDELVDQLEADESDEWDDELAEVPDTPDDESSEEWKPSDWLQCEVQYKPPKSLKALVFTVVIADDTEMCVVLERNGKKTGQIAYADLILPDPE